MRRRLCLLAVVAGFAVAGLLPATAASERYEVAVGVGYRCTADAVVQNRTLLVAGQYGSTSILQATVGGVITGWGVEVAPGTAPLAQQLVVFEPLGNGTYRKVAESRLETVSPGINSFETRLPVKGGESVGLFGPAGTLACDEKAETQERDAEGNQIEPGEAISLGAEGSTAVGGTLTFETLHRVGTPLPSAIEPDQDGDDYGDYSQDRCRGTASRGSDCPIGSKIVGAEVKRRAIVIAIKAQARAGINVQGQVLWHDRPGPNGRLVGVHLDGGSKPVRAGRTAYFRVPLPRPVLRRLARLPRGKSLVARIEAFVTDRDGWESERRRRVRLWGRH
jgi:hypothetical protein